MATSPPSPADIGRHGMTLRNRMSARQMTTSKPGQIEMQPSPAETMRQNTESQPQARSRSHSQRQPVSYDSSDDEILLPMQLSAFTKALLNDERPKPGARYALSDERPTSPSSQFVPQASARRSSLAPSTSSLLKDRGYRRESIGERRISGDIGTESQKLTTAKPTSPPASQSRGGSPAPRKRVVRLSRTSGSGILQNGSRRSLSPPKQETRAESRRLSTERESHFQAQDEMNEWQAKQEYAQRGINTPVSSDRTGRGSVGSSGRRIQSAGSAAASIKHFGAGYNASTPANPATSERAYPADCAGSVTRDDNSSRREDPELRSTTRPKRVISVSGSHLGGPARRARRRQTEEYEEELGEKLPANAGSPEIQRAQTVETAVIDQPAIASSTPKVPISSALDSPFQRNHGTPTANCKRTSQTRLSETHAKRTSSNHELPHHEPLSLSKPRSVHAKEIQPSSSANLRRASTKALDEELSKPARPLNLDTGSSAPRPAATPSERRALAVKSRGVPFSPAPPPPQPKMPVIQTATTAQSTKKKQFLMRVNGKAYRRIDCIGRGGSGRVYRVATTDGTVLALKRVSLEQVDELTERALKREIELLERLRGVERVIQLLDYEMNREKKSVFVLMEVGELDFNSFLRSRQSGIETRPWSFDITLVRYYWREMVECVRAIHEQAVVHSDLKPANFVLVKGRLKLIDFGIANAIQTDVTINVHRETMAGTVNYMSPESLMDSTQYALTTIHNGHPYIPASGVSRVVKVGTPSDVWSLGCILYQMVYGIPPFGMLAEPRLRIQAIVNWSHDIEFPSTTEDGTCVPVALLETMRRCLSRDQKDRPTCETLLSEADDFLYPKEYNTALSSTGDGQLLPMTEELLGRLIQSVRMRCKEGFPADDKALEAWTANYWVSLEKAVAKSKS
ncbi:hypothetical protein FBULB1_12844 [Fusarium bulbicola]|nr:hypothetical protein FBULB1_12844 [Fusarium bulbicola]